MPNRKNLNSRLNYRGGANQQDRMNADKLRSLKKALLYSYQAATAILSDGREFRCLINSNKLSMDLDNKILSIPFKDVCLNAKQIIGDLDKETNQSDEGDWETMVDLIATLSYKDTWEDMVSEEDIPDLPNPEPEIIPGEVVETGIKEGDVITWKENGSHWLVYLRRLEETAYFRADMRRCRYELTLGNGSKYWAYVRGPVEQSILWSQVSNNYFNKLNYTLVMYIQQNEETLKYFHRFKKVMINNQPWEVQVVDSISTPGILEISLKETYNNTIETNLEEVVNKAIQKIEVLEQEGAYIHGPITVYPYDTCIYEIKNYKDIQGFWTIQNESRKNMIKVISNDNQKIELSIITGKSGKFTLIYKTDEKIISSLDINIDSL